jgi:hypothetical protein
MDARPTGIASDRRTCSFFSGTFRGRGQVAERADNGVEFLRKALPAVKVLR